MTRSSADSTSEAVAHSGPEIPRRHLLVEALAVVIGGLITLIPLGAGIALLLDPVLRKRKGGGGDGFLRVATLDSVPADGSPQMFPVIADKADAWTYSFNQRIGSVFLRRVSPTEVQAFNTVCPHLGCMVAYVPARGVFNCPCHNSAFNQDGSKIEEPGRTNPSPRPLDSLAVDPERLKQGEVWVKFENFQTGKHEKIAK